jgi:glutamyl-tRNA reductase
MNYTNAPIDILEQCACNKDDVTSYLSETIGSMFFDEMVIVSTCNRTEWVFISSAPQKSVDLLLTKIKDQTHVSKTILERHTTVLHGFDALAHLFQVVCGLKSMVLGENEILTQIKDHYATCMEFGATSAYLNKLFQLLIATGKDVRTATNISKGAHSISSIAIEAIKATDPDFLNRPMLLIGAGVMIQRALAKLAAMGHQDLCIANRTMSKAETLTALYPNTRVIPFASIKRELYRFDIVYAGVYSSSFILTVNDFKHMSDQKIVVDVSLPRSIDPNIGSLETATFISVDSLEAVANQTIQNRQRVIPHVESMIRVALSDFNDWLTYRNESIDWVNERFPMVI